MATVRWTYTKARECAERIDHARTEKVRQLCKAAGLSPELLGIHPHNAMVAYKSGKPWAGVDYSKMRKILWLLDRRFDGYRVLERYTRKRDRKNRFWTLEGSK